MAEQQVQAGSDGEPRPAAPPPLAVVGIGASAGGLAALTRLLPAIPVDSGLAWVVVVHLSPEHESHLAELLQPHAAIPVHQVTETTELSAGHVYVIPPNANLNAIDTHLRLSRLDGRPGKRATVDHFFRTLSKTHDGHAIGVVLTGTGSDGSLGLKDIKERGGMAVVQDPAEAEYDGMPRSAIATGLVDLVLPLEQIPEAVLRYAHTEPHVLVRGDGDGMGSDARRSLRQVLSHLRARTGRDFTQYRQSTITRRIVRRMQLRHIEELDQYLALLHEKEEEVRTLVDDLLITVTSFFRDPAAFDAVEKLVVPQLFDRRNLGEEIRVWSAGCATGEEAYSLAMLLLEAEERLSGAHHIQVFASDLHEPSLRTAREGFYPAAIETDVSAERLARFFEKEDGGYRIRAEVRDVVVFSSHDVLRDPPFSRIDLIACRNLLIYLQAHVQQDVLQLFHYALSPSGFLMLGASERVGDELFRADDREHGIYRRRNVPAPEARLPAFPMTGRLVRSGDAATSQSEATSYGTLHHRMVERYASPSVLLNAEDRVVHISEHAGRYLVHDGGEPTTRATRLLRAELRTDFQTALHQVRERNERIRTRPVKIVLDGQPRSVVLDLHPSRTDEESGFVLVLFDEAAPGASSGMSGAVPTTTARSAQTEEAVGVIGEVDSTQADDRVRELEAELRLAGERLQAVIERYEANREEMNAANEELQSSNEELRSTMEELETSREELQSTNEELQAVNQENRHKVAELAQLSADLQNLLTSTDIATLFLDRQLRILRFTPKVEELFHVRPVDRGRPISDLRYRLGYDELVDDAQRVLERLLPIEREVRDEQGRWYLSKVLPYRSVDDRIEGVVLTFVDITHRKQAEEEIHRAKTFAESIVETLHVPLLVLDAELHVRSANAAFYEHFGARPGQTEGRLVYELGNGQWNIPELRKLLEEILPENSVLNDFEVQHEFEGIGKRVMLLDARRLDHVDLILLGIRDTTQRKMDEEALRLAKAEAEHANQAKSHFLSTMSHELRTPLTAVLGFADLLEGEVAGDMNERQKEYLGRIKKSAWHLVRIIDEILSFSRTEAGKERIRLEPVDLAQVAHDVAHMLEATATELSRALDVHGADAPVRVVSDSGRVAQILTNLVGNALKYAPSGTVEIELIDAGAWAEVSVSDHGPGIPQDQWEVIFAPFTQIDGSSTRRQGGAGLGLTIARRLAHLLGGDLTVRSEIGEGSTFTLRLPRDGPLSLQTVESDSPAVLPEAAP